jgi:nucleotide sugar dehydrogenase
VRTSLERASGLRAGEDFFLGVSPERINTGVGSLPFHEIPKLIAGIGEGSLMRMRDFYSTLVEKVIEVSGTLEAELAKLLENTFRQVNIALVNEVSKTSRALGADPWEVLRAASTKPFGFMAFRPGAGTGGHCVPSASETLASVARKVGARLAVVEAANMVNLSMPEYVLGRVKAALARQGRALAGSRIVVLGLAYKPGVSETRNSSGVRMANLLSSHGAIVWTIDPLVNTCPELDPKISVLSPGKNQQANFDLALVTCTHPGWDVKPLLSRCREVLDATFSLEGQEISYP